jgi:hypothetical protein
MSATPEEPGGAAAAFEVLATTPPDTLALAAYYIADRDELAAFAQLLADCAAGQLTDLGCWVHVRSPEAMGAFLYALSSLPPLHPAGQPARYEILAERVRGNPKAAYYLRIVASRACSATKRRRRTGGVQ